MSENMSQGCINHFNRIDDRLNEVSQNISEIGGKLSALHTDNNNFNDKFKNVAVDHDNLLIVKKDVEGLSDGQREIHDILGDMEEEHDGLDKRFNEFSVKVSENLNNLAAYQNSTVDKLTLLVKKDNNSFKSQLISGISVGLLITLVISLVAFVFSHALKSIKTEVIKSLEDERIEQWQYLSKHYPPGQTVPGNTPINTPINITPVNVPNNNGKQIK